MNGVNTVSVPGRRPAAGVGLRLVGSQPIRSEAELEYSLPAAGRVELALFDAAGRRVADLAGGWHGAGTYKARWAAQSHPAGVYFARLTLDGRISTTVRLVLLSG